MNRSGWKVGWCFIITLMAQMLSGCASSTTISPGFTLTPIFAGSAAGVSNPPNPDYASAQATMDAGQSQLLDLSQKATLASMDMNQAADAAALATSEFNQRLKMELDFQSTQISQNIRMAAATQEYISQQTKLAQAAIEVDQTRAAEATQSAYLFNVTQTAQAQAMLDARIWQTDQAVAALTAYPQTATPLAATQAALLMQKYDREQQSFEDQVVAPLIPFIALLDVLLVFLGIILALFRYLPRYMTITWPRRLRITQINPNPGPLNLVERIIVEHDPRRHRRIPSELTPINPPLLPVEYAEDIEIEHSDKLS